MSRYNSVKFGAAKPQMRKPKIIYSEDLGWIFPAQEEIDRYESEQELIFESERDGESQDENEE